MAKHTLRARRARPGETLTTLDGVERQLATAGRGLGDTGVDGVIVDGDDHVLGLAGIMGGSSSEIDDGTTEVLLEAAYFDPMTIARSSKRHGMRSEASHRFERGVDPQLPLRAAARFVRSSKRACRTSSGWRTPWTCGVRCRRRRRSRFAMATSSDFWASTIAREEIVSILTRMNFAVRGKGHELVVTAPSRRPDIREGSLGRADVIEEIARLYGYRRIHVTSPLGQKLAVSPSASASVVACATSSSTLGALEAWTASLGSDADFDLLHPGVERVRMTNPLSSDESVLRATLVTGLVRAWAKNFERGTG